MFTCNIIVSDADKERAKADHIVLLDDQDLSYYESLFQHLGVAAKYQVLADIFPNRQIPGLKITVPALLTKVGDYKYYTFAIRRRIQPRSATPCLKTSAGVL